MIAPSNGRRMLVLGSGMLLMFSSQGCLATRGWVTEQLAPVDGRLSQTETRLSRTEARVGSAETKMTNALDRFDHLRLEKKLVLNLKEGSTFAFNSSALTDDTKRQIDGLLGDVGTVDDKVFLIAGHTDSTGSTGYNYELGQQRAATVAQYLITRKGVDPLHVTTMSYGKNAPIAANSSPGGRSKNRRIEILVYKENIASSSEKVATR